jgi:hypothetical protein
MPDPQRNESARRETLRFLCDRSLLAHTPAAIRNGVNREGFDFAKDEILGALDVLRGLSLIEAITEPLGSSRVYKATAAGVLHHERNP